MVVPHTDDKALFKNYIIHIQVKTIARSYVFWPNIDKELEEQVKNCNLCRMNSKNPDRTDYAEPINGKYFLITIDT